MYVIPACVEILWDICREKITWTSVSYDEKKNKFHNFNLTTMHC